MLGFAIKRPPRPSEARRRPRCRPEVCALEGRSLLSTVPDTTPPAVVGLAANPPVLWPPNGRSVAVVITGVTVDNPGGTGVNPATISAMVFSSYPTMHPITGRFRPTAVGPLPGGVYTFRFVVPLSARRFGFERLGRLYTVVVDAANFANNIGQGTVGVLVPHDLGNHSSPPALQGGGRGGHGHGHGPRLKTGGGGGPAIATGVGDHGLATGRQGEGHSGKGHGAGAAIVTSGPGPIRPGFAPRGDDREGPKDHGPHGHGPGGR
ncbi:MAG: hypothetical protein IRY99_14855 [Isosphaeraceae bacterium]|nr:hypothetical protein [Isosphaeraceae bacterium]